MDEDNGYYRCYVPKKFSEEHETIIANSNAIIAEYGERGFTLTLRQLFYQHVSRALLGNTDANYKRLGGIISDARIAGLVSWTAIEDRGRNLRGINTVSGPGEAIKRARQTYAIDMWAGQPCRVEVWVEKEALVGVISGICSKLRVDFFATKGYNSQSEQWRAGQRFAGYVTDGQRPIVLHLGDHDPSGIDMTRDNKDRLSMFAGVPILVQRIALNMDQVEHYDPPPNPTKLTDSRADDYIRQFGHDCWELDALDPQVIANLIQTRVMLYRDEKLWSERLAEEANDKDSLDLLIEQFGEAASDDDED